MITTKNRGNDSQTWQIIRMILEGYWWVSNGCSGVSYFQTNPNHIKLDIYIYPIKRNISITIPSISILTSNGTISHQLWSVFFFDFAQCGRLGWNSSWPWKSHLMLWSNSTISVFQGLMCFFYCLILGDDINTLQSCLIFK